MDYRIQIKDNDYPEPYEKRKRKFSNKPIPNSLRKCIKQAKQTGILRKAYPSKHNNKRNEL